MQLRIALAIPLVCATLALAPQLSAQQAKMVQPSAQQAPGLLTGLHKNYVPTAANFGQPINVDFGGYTRKKGNILLCKATIDECIVANMPLLWQKDSRLIAPLTAFLAGYEVNGSLPITDDDGKPQTDGNGKLYTAATFAPYYLSVGCFITSQVTVTITSLANRAGSVPLTGQTATFDAIGGQGKIGVVGGTGQLPGNLPASLSKLLWQYEHHFIFQEIDKNKPDNQKTRYLGFPAVVSDVSGGLQQPCDLIKDTVCKWGEIITGLNGNGHALASWSPAAAELNNDTVKALMQADRVILLAYGRYTPTVSLEVNSGRPGMHKIAVSGFQPGKFPLLINDVGNGQRYKVRLSSDLGSLRFSAGQLGGSRRNTKIRYVLKHADGTVVEIPGWPFLAYEGDSEKTNPQVFFIDHYNYLHVRAGLDSPVLPPQNVEQGGISKPGPDPVINSPKN